MSFGRSFSSVVYKVRLKTTAPKDPEQKTRLGEVNHIYLVHVKLNSVILEVSSYLDDSVTYAGKPG